MAKAKPTLDSASPILTACIQAGIAHMATHGDLFDTSDAGQSRLVRKIDRIIEVAMHIEDRLSN